MRTLNQDTLMSMEHYIKEYQMDNGRSPSYRNIMHSMGMSSLNLVQRYVLALEREGKIQRTQLGNIELPSQLDKGETTIAPLDIVDEVIVLGHSVNKIDLPYFEWLFRGLPENINWKVSYYNEDEKKVIEKNLTIVGVSNYKLYKIDEILDIC